MDTNGTADRLRASDQERDAAVKRLQIAFSEGRLDDEEFDVRVRTALSARTHAELDTLFTDLSGPTSGTRARPGGRFMIAYKDFVRRGGRWRMPERFFAVVYKGGGQIDLRAAELIEPTTNVFAISYKSDLQILVPPGVRVELEGFGVSRGTADEDGDLYVSPDAPVVHVRGVGYKGLVMVHTKSPKNQ